MSNINKYREEFENWCRENTKWDLYWSENLQQYMDHQTNGAWMVFEVQQKKFEDLEEMYIKQGLHLFNLQKLREGVLKKLESNGEKAWVKWREGADMYDQGSANAFEEAYWLLHDVMGDE